MAFFAFIILLKILEFASACPVFLTISLSGKIFQDSNIIINWGPECNSKPEWIGIFFEDPSVSNTQPEMRITDIKNSSGQFMTHLKIGKLRFPRGWNRNEINLVPPTYRKGKCLPYYVASFNGNELLAVECLKINPTWMSTLQNINKIPLKNLFLPGSHAAGAYVSNNLKDRILGTKDYVVAQHFDVWTQLVFGIRFLDISIGYKIIDKFDDRSPDNFWIVNENMFANHLISVLKDVRQFVNLSNDVVILDFSQFPIGFYKHPERHKDLLHILYEEIGDLTFNRSSSKDINCYEFTVEDVKRADKSVLILYPLQELPNPESADADILCPSWKRFTTANMNATQTLDLMRQLFSKKTTSPVQDEGWIFHGIQSLEHALNYERMLTNRERAAEVNPRVMGWLKGPWAANANVVAIDFFGSTNLIDDAIYANLQKAFNKINRSFVNFEVSTN